MKRFNFALAALFILATVSCSDDDTSINTKGDYFPLQKLEWRYKRTIIYSSELPAQDFGTYTLRTTGTLLADGKHYYTVTSGDKDYIEFEARRDGAEYFERNALFEDNKEYKFLDTKKDVGQSWTYSRDEYIKKIDYTVLSKNVFQNINGTAYRNVITIGIDYYLADDTGELYRWMSAEHVYAEGIGEVYSFVPSPISQTYGNVKSVRVKK